MLFPVRSGSFRVPADPDPVQPPSPLHSARGAAPGSAGAELAAPPSPTPARAPPVNPAQGLRGRAQGWAAPSERRGGGGKEEGRHGGSPSGPQWLSWRPRAAPSQE